MRDRLNSLLHKADIAVSSCSGVVGADDLEPVIESVRAVRTRLSCPDDVLVVALAGGTGSGKSSLFNALIGEEKADVGGSRPTTSEPEAAVPAEREADLSPYLDLLRVRRRHVYESRDLCLIDLPDMDSVVIEHRHRVDAILPLVDVVTWVTDPEKYRDLRIHHEYLKPLASYRDQFVFVLNQIDRLSNAQSVTLVEDLILALGEDGIEDADVLPVAASPVAGPPIGIDDLRRVLMEKTSDRDRLYSKLLADVGNAARHMAARVGESVAFDTEAASIVEQASGQVVDADLAGATETLTGFLDGVAEVVGGQTRVRLELLTGDVPQHTQRISDQTTPAEGGRWRRRKAETVRDPATVRRLIEESVIRPARALLAKREVSIDAIADLISDVENLQSTPPQ